ncbi:MAG: YraN family protein [Alphaproteobacteria bacterium]|nr:YraN family protein [Alphaproteobacteria bacterium]MCK5659692.1 YraN family protein [Alphaproteobacteria bacterium]
MRTSHQKGLRAEAFAGLYLRLKGYRVLEERWKTHLGEIDLIIRRGRRLAFVEVKLRGTAEAAVEAIHSKNRSRVRNAAELYLQKHPEYNGWELSFDALVMVSGAWPKHIRNAW